MDIAVFSFPPLGIGSGVWHTWVDSAPPLPNSVNVSMFFNLFKCVKPENSSILTGLLRQAYEIRTSVVTINNIECLLMSQELC